MTACVSRFLVQFICSDSAGLCFCYLTYPNTRLSAVTRTFHRFYLHAPTSALKHYESRFSIKASCTFLPPLLLLRCLLPNGLTLAHCSLAFCQSWFLSPAPSLLFALSPFLSPIPFSFRSLLHKFSINVVRDLPQSCDTNT